MSLKKWICTASNFMALILSHSIFQVLAFFWELNSKSSGKEKESRRLPFTSSTKRESRKFCFVIVQWQQGNARAKLFCRSKHITFLPFLMTSPSLLPKLPNYLLKIDLMKVMLVFEGFILTMIRWSLLSFPSVRRMFSISGTPCKMAWLVLGEHKW